MRRSPAFVLAFALLGISFAGPLVKLSNADPLAIAAWRLGFSLAIVGVFLVATKQWKEWRTLGGRDTSLAVLGGVFLALHFWAWNASIHLTTIAASVTLVSLQPAIVAAVSSLILREAPTGRQMAGMSLAIAGALVIAAPELLHGATVANRPLLGNALAASGALTAALYYIIGRRLRSRLGIWAYVGIVYSSAFIALVAIACARGARLTPQPGREIAIFAGLALGPMLLGHTGMNWALRFLPAYVVNLLVLGEPIGATALGALIPAIRQIPGPLTFVGGAIVLAGVLIAVSASRPEAA